MARSPVAILCNLYGHRHLLVQMVLREVKGRFAGSLGGVLWNFLHPILMLVSYLFVFVYIFKLRVGAGTGASVIYIMAGLFPWVIMAEGFARGTAAVLENAALIQKTFFPTEILVAKAVIAPVLSHGIAVVLLALYSLATQLPSGGLQILAALPVMMLLQLLFTLGISLLCATLTVFFRDVTQLVHLLLSFWIFLTPILYPVSMLPEWALTAMYANPLFPIVSVYQSLFMHGTVGPWQMLLLAAGWSAAFLAAGSFVFSKLKYEFADWL